MSASNNHRSSISRISRRTQVDQQIHDTRSTSTQRRQVIIILTNNPEILEHARVLQPQVKN